MVKHIVRWNVGYGDDYELTDDCTLGEAEEIAANNWNEEIQSHADYEAMEFTKENACEYDFEDEHREEFPDEWKQDDDGDWV